MSGIVKGRHAVEAVARSLLKLGFYRTRQHSSASIYLRCPENQFTLRISNHPLKRKSRVIHNHIALSQTIPNELDLADSFMTAFDIALRFCVMARVRLGLIGEGEALELCRHP